MNQIVSVIIVNYNTRSLLGQCIDSLIKNKDGFDLEIIVVDNASSDSSTKLVRSNFPSVKLIENTFNKGFATANNQGINTANGTFILLLNSDTVVHAGALRSMVNCLQDQSDIGICSCKLLNKDGSIQHGIHGWPTFAAMLHRYTIFKYTGLFKNARDRYRSHNFDYNSCGPVDVLNGACMMTKSETLKKTGLLDENLFFYFEEADICSRMKQHGLNAYYTPQGSITHLGGESSSSLGSHKTTMYFFKSMFYYFRKHSGRTKTFLFAILFKPTALLYMIIETLSCIVSGLILRISRTDRATVKLGRAKQNILFIGKFFFRFINC